MLIIRVICINYCNNVRKRNSYCSFMIQSKNGDPKTGHFSNQFLKDLKDLTKLSI
jgi:hypothetical protein